MGAGHEGDVELAFAHLELRVARGASGDVQVDAGLNQNDAMYRRLRNRLKDAILLARKRVSWNYRAVVPQYYPKHNLMSFLLPISLSDDTKVDAALVVQSIRVDGKLRYQGYTIYPLYNEKFAVFEQMRGDPLGYLRDGSYAYARFALENPTLYRLMFSPPPKLGVSDDPWSSEASRQVLSLLLTGLRSSQEHGYLPGADLRRYGFMFWSTIHGAVSLNIQNRLLDHAAKWDSTQSVIDALMEMIAATGPAKHPITS